MSHSLDDERKRRREQRKRELKQQLEQPDAAQADVESPAEPIPITGTDHFDEVVASYPLVLVDCYADWCGPCKMLEPTIEALAAETVATVAKVDVDQHQELAQRFGVRGVPTLVFYVDGEAVNQLVGLQDRTTLENLINEYR